MEPNKKILETLKFFGVTIENIPQIRLNLFSQIHQILFHGKGGYDYDTVYNMPIWLRKFTFNEMKKFYDAEQEAHNKSTTGKNQTNLVNPNGKINTPAFMEASKGYKKQTSYK